MKTFDPKEHPHTRLNILTGDWILVSPHRSHRPWQGKIENTAVPSQVNYDPACYLCPGNARADGSHNPHYKETYAFTNDFSALIPCSPQGEVNEKDLLVAKSEQGVCRVLCFSPDHSRTLSKMTEEEIGRVVELWRSEFVALSHEPEIHYVQIFENKGELMGCSNPHPHGQIWASSSVPRELVKETEKQKAYFERFGRSLLESYLEEELKQKERIVLEDEAFVALVPYWAIWPYETMVISKRSVQHIGQLTNQETRSFSRLLKRLTHAYDQLFETPFPYSAGIHQSPVNQGDQPWWHMHMHFFPPLLRSATIKKHMVGYEMLASPQRDITPEYAAEALRALTSI